MTTTISPDDYCKHPENYKNNPTITDQTRQYWDQYCSLKNTMEQKSPSADGLRKAIPEALTEFIMMIFSPQGLEMISAFVGIKIAYNSVKAGIGSFVKSGLDPEIIAKVDELVAKGGDEAIANAGGVMFGLGKDIVYLDVKVAEKAGFSAGRYAIAALFDAIEEIFSAFNEALMVLMLVSMVFDAWDPCSLNTMLDNNSIQQFVRGYNTAFRSTAVSQLESVTDSYGRTMYTEQWPIEFYVENSLLRPFYDKKYQDLEMNYFFAYLNSLNFNSCGLPILKVKAGTGKVINNKIITGLEPLLLGYLDNDNTVVTNWLIKWWPLLLGFFLVFIVIIFAIRNKAK